jgi:hypothetical protein
MARHGQFCLKHAKTLSIVRAWGANRETLDFWFDLYKGWLSTSNFCNPQKLWNVDETGLMDIPSSGMVMGKRGQPAFKLVGAEKGQLFTVLCFVSAGGVAAPPMVIFKGVNVQNAWREAAPSGWCEQVRMGG